MLYDFVQRRMRWTVLPTLVVALLLTTVASGGHHRDRCPDCGNAACVPSFEKAKEKKHCWCIECEQICIPHIRWPWQSCCDLPKYGRVKNVKVLKKVEYECEACGCKWDVKRVDCCPIGACRN